MGDLTWVLKKCVLFRDLADDVIKSEVLPMGTLREIPKRQFLLLYQERLDFFGVVISGKLHTFHIYSDGSYNIIDAIEEGEVYGADLVWTKSRVSPYYAAAASTLSILMFPVAMIMQRGFISEESRQQIISKLLMLVSHDNIRKEYRLAILAQKGLRERIVTYLTMQANKRHTASFTIPFSREELASYLCVNRSALSHELSVMQQEGLIRFRKNVFTLLHWEDDKPREIK